MASSASAQSQDKIAFSPDFQIQARQTTNAGGIFKQE